jgi:hypothetical protein
MSTVFQRLRKHTYVLLNNRSVLFAFTSDGADMIDDCNPQEVIHMHFQMLQILPLPINVKFKHSKIW